MSASATVTSLTSRDGARLALYDWPASADTPARAKVLIVHGLGEHAQRYDKLAKKLNDWGFAVRSYDQFGHGQSSGARGGLERHTQLLDHLGEVIAATRAALNAGQRLVLLGHSMGGLVAARAVLGGLAPDALVLSSPALYLGLNPVQKLLLAVLPRVLPNLAVSNSLDTNYLSHDPAVVAAYRADPLVHDRICGRLARFMAVEANVTLAAAPHWKTPTLLLYAGQDKLVNPEGSRRFAQNAPAEHLSSHCFSDHYHEIFNEHQVDVVLASLRLWLEQRLA